MKPLSVVNEAFLVYLDSFLDKGIGCPAALLKLLKEAVQRRLENTYFIPLRDEELPPHLQPTAKKWRKLAQVLGYRGNRPIAWLFRGGFTLKRAPLVGPCLGHIFQGLSSIPNEPTKESIVFWIPKLIPDSMGKTVAEKRIVLGKLRVRVDLPSHHLQSFGNVTLLAGLSLGYFAETGECIPVDPSEAASETFVDDRCFVIGFDNRGLIVGQWNFNDPHYERASHIGCFPFAIEELETSD